MTSQEYRERAVSVLRPINHRPLTAQDIAEAAVWAQLATAAAIEEQAKGVRDGE
ncbi:hypothetical protein J7E88_30715 [Streptomyces sp. ISL-10]|uniref:hypothetical protein n=1 Tax=Streptomyces sp. ISL-10 TaxID=2819172 RepID=UPI001BEC60E3|nr:hypothetical protein [Streptomyces sp. ISL-10]MBT2369530.1 hypothetical protein [Streptomyces sp. ISL-10]